VRTKLSPKKVFSCAGCRGTKGAERMQGEADEADTDGIRYTLHFSQGHLGQLAQHKAYVHLIEGRKKRNIWQVC
jgi:hypothetical protein